MTPPAAAPATRPPGQPAEDQVELEPTTTLEELRLRLEGEAITLMAWLARNASDWDASDEDRQALAAAGTRP